MRCVPGTKRLRLGVCAAAIAPGGPSLPADTNHHHHHHDLLRQEQQQQQQWRWRGTEAELLMVLRDAALALHHMHRRGIAHMDVKVRFWGG